MERSIIHLNITDFAVAVERLLEVVQEAKSMTADSLLKEMMVRVNEFVGDAAQHDDLTVIVINTVG